MSPARRCAYAVLRRVFEGGAYADRALVSEAAGLGPRERALAMQIAYGAVQRRATLDHLALGLVRGPLATLEPAVLAAIRIGLFQLLYLKGVPDHAAVDETVELVKAERRAAAGLVNAVLRRAARERASLLGRLSDDTPGQAAVAHSVPEWLAELWWRELGAGEARALLRHINRPAETALRVNSLISSTAAVSRELPVRAEPAVGVPEGLVLDGAFDIRSSPLFAAGAITPQSRASMLVARVLAPEPGHEVLDLCAAPGAKTTHLAALMKDRGRVTAVERHPGRARELEATCRRMRAACVEVRVKDAREPAGEARFDRVLLDPPCSGLGTLQSRPDRRWRVSAESIAELAGLQAQLLDTAAAATRPGGTLVYSVCTISRREGPELIDAFLDSRPGWRADALGTSHPEWRNHGEERYLQLLPHRDLTDGFFIARLLREPR